MSKSTSGLTRRQFIATAGSAAAASLSITATGCGRRTHLRAGEAPNVLFISIDDLNDWIGVLGGYEGTVNTPNIDRLASEGVVFRNAHCTAPLCNPSRTSVLTGLRPSTTGVYLNRDDSFFREHPDVVTLPQHFRASGYYTSKAFKLFHGWAEENLNVWDSRFLVNADHRGNLSERKLTIESTTGGKLKSIRWGQLYATDEQLPEMVATRKFSDFLSQEPDRPFFSAFGFTAPHAPWYAPRKYFDIYPLESVILPTINRKDLEDVPPIGLKWALSLSSQFPGGWTEDEWKSAVRGYLACISYADACVGRLLAVLDRSAYRDNTIVILWSDHGGHLGEKLHTSKMTLWEESTRVPLMVRAPGAAATGIPCDRVVSLIDIYPTLIELCRLPAISELEGVSLVPLLKNPQAQWNHPAITTYGEGNHAVRTERWRYIRYRDQTEELYDHESDPREWINLANDPAFADVKKRLIEFLSATGLKVSST